jgi:hypothetical protein
MVYTITVGSCYRLGVIVRMGQHHALFVTIPEQDSLFQGWAWAELLNRGRMRAA